MTSRTGQEHERRLERAWTGTVDGAGSGEQSDEAEGARQGVPAEEFIGFAAHQDDAEREPKGDAERIAGEPVLPSTARSSTWSSWEKMAATGKATSAGPRSTGQTMNRCRSRGCFIQLDRSVSGGETSMPPRLLRRCLTRSQRRSAQWLDVRRPEAD